MANRLFVSGLALIAVALGLWLLAYATYRWIFLANIGTVQAMAIGVVSHVLIWSAVGLWLSHLRSGPRN